MKAYFLFARYEYPPAVAIACVMESPLT